jgi:hypothetical protein
MTQKQSNLQRRRLDVLKRMQEEYLQVFGVEGANGKKTMPKDAPKAKAYHAAGLLTILEKQGEEKFKEKLQSYIAANQATYNQKKAGKTVKAKPAKKVTMAAAPPAAANVAGNAVPEVPEMAAAANAPANAAAPTKKAGPPAALIAYMEKLEKAETALLDHMRSSKELAMALANSGGSASNINAKLFADICARCPKRRAAGSKTKKAAAGGKKKKSGGSASRKNRAANEY